MLLQEFFDAEYGGSGGRAFDLGSKGCWLEPHCWQRHCVVSLSKTLYPLFSNSFVDPECFVSGGPTLTAFYLFTC